MLLFDFYPSHGSDNGMWDKISQIWWKMRKTLSCMQEYKNLSWVWGAEKSIQGSLFGITRLCWMMPNSDPEGWMFLSVPNSHDRFFFLHTFWSPAFDFNIGVAINVSCSYMLTSTILKVSVVCDVAMTSAPNILTTELCDLLYNHCIDNTSCYLFFFYLSHGLDKGM